MSIFDLSLTLDFNDMPLYSKTSFKGVPLKSRVYGNKKNNSWLLQFVFLLNDSLNYWFEFKLSNYWATLFGGKTDGFLADEKLLSDISRLIRIIFSWFNIGFSSLSIIYSSLSIRFSSLSIRFRSLSIRFSSLRVRFSSHNIRVSIRFS